MYGEIMKALTINLLIPISKKLLEYFTFKVEQYLNKKRQKEEEFEKISKIP